MLPSSRTPEGNDNQCLICGHEVYIEPSVPPGDAPCPHCGALLWFPSVSSQDRKAAVLWQQSHSEIEAENWLDAAFCLQQAIAIDRRNSVFRETLSKVMARFCENVEFQLPENLVKD